jgi:NADH-quinone oxidoreductase subunit L
MARMMNVIVWLIPAFPALAVLLNGLLGRRVFRERAHLLGVGSVGLSLLLALIVILRVIWNPHQPIHAKLYTWIFAGAFTADMAFLVDPLSAIMLFVVCGVGFLVHVYSIGYMHGDPSYPRFFTYLNLFMTSMLILVLADNYLLMFVGWEGVGLCSYLLIGFWYDRQSATDAGKKAFLVNRIGDAGFILAISLIFWTTGSLNYAEVFAKAADHTVMTAGIATAITLLLFVGATGKSAQVPLYVWLPDAMEGPTPVSALIHAATMVTAGVYMVVRSQALFLLAPFSMQVVAFIGAFTAIFAASIGLVQNDIKRVLAYSTVSQLGYMFLGCGVGAFSSGLFHVMTHAFFKGLLFLGAGSVIHAMHDEQDMRHMGGLQRHIPDTYRTMKWATIAIAGIPPLAGFWSKDEILTAALKSGNVLWWLFGLCAAFMTSFYMFRLLFMTFYGRERFDAHHVHPHESPPAMLFPLKVLAVLSIVGGIVVGIPPENGLFHRFVALAFHHGHHAHAFHLWPDFFLMILSTLVALAGFFTAYVVYLEPAARPQALFGRISTAMRVLWRQVIWDKAPVEAFYTERAERLSERFALLYAVLLNKYRVDEFYQAYVVRPLMWATDALWTVDARVVDGIVNGCSALTRLYANWSGILDRLVVDGSVNGVALIVQSGARAFRLLQTGIVQNYLLVMALGVFVFATIYLILI